MIDFPNNPTVGQQFTAAGVTWTWDGAKWVANGLNVPYLPLTGGTLTGPLTLVGNPAAALQPATKQYVDYIEAAYPLGDNRIINGDMRISQRWGGASAATSSGYGLDRWAFYGTLNGAFTAGQNLNAIAGPVGFPYYWGFQSTAAHALAAADVFQIYQPIEADMIGDFAFGTANAQPVTLSFWARSSLTGTFGGVVANYNVTRSYPFTYLLPTANTWTKIALTIPGDTTGTWVMSGNGGALHVILGLGVGATGSGPSNVWASTSYNSATGAVSPVSTNGATFYITGVKLEIGSVATLFNHQSLAKSLADCQRYYEKSYNAGDRPGTATIASGEFLYASGPGSGLGGGGMSTRFSVAKRAQPTITVYSGLTGSSGAIFDQNSNVDVAATIFSVGDKSFGWYGAPSAGNGINFLVQWTAEAEL